MTQYLMPKARCLSTGQVVKSNNLGSKFTPGEQRQAQAEAQRLAENMQAKTNLEWQAFVEAYTLDSQGRTRL